MYTLVLSDKNRALYSFGERSREEDFVVESAIDVPLILFDFECTLLFVTVAW